MPKTPDLANDQAHNLSYIESVFVAADGKDAASLSLSSSSLLSWRGRKDLLRSFHVLRKVIDMLPNVKRNL
jgi:hypothetical protein